MYNYCAVHRKKDQYFPQFCFNKRKISVSIVSAIGGRNCLVLVNKDNGRVLPPTARFNICQCWNNKSALNGLVRAVISIFIYYSDAGLMGKYSIPCFKN